MATPTVDPLVAKTGINITKQQLDENRKKWQSQGVREYTATIEYSAFSEFMGTWTLHVQSDGASARILDYERDPNGAFAPMGFVGSQANMPTTVEGIEGLKDELKFLAIEKQFNDLELYVSGKYSQYVDTFVEFDPALGYVSSINAVDKPTAADAGFRWKVTNLRILKRTASPVP